MLTYTEGLFIGYRGYDRDGREPLFPFGHGRGYTTWSYESITVDCDPDQADPASRSASTVRNTGARPGREVVQVYASRPDSAVERPAKWLAGFAAVDADPGETVNVGILIPERAFQHWSDGGLDPRGGHVRPRRGLLVRVPPAHRRRHRQITRLELQRQPGRVEVVEEQLVDARYGRSA